VFVRCCYSILFHCKRQTAELLSIIIIIIILEWLIAAKSLKLCIEMCRDLDRDLDIRVTRVMLRRRPAHVRTSLVRV